MRRTENIATAALVLAAVAALGFVNLSNGDTGFHLATGRYVLSAGEIPARNVLSFTQPDHRWISHEWLAGVVFEWAWRAGGPRGLLLLKLPLLLVTFGLVYRTARRLCGSSWAAGMATVLAAWASAFRFVERPQLFSNLALAMVVWLVGGWIGSTVPRRWHTAAPWLVVLVLAINYQLHAGAINGLFFVLAVAVGTGLEAWRSRVAAVADAYTPHAQRWAASLLAVGARWARGVSGARSLLALAGLSVAAAGALLWQIHPHGLSVLWLPLQLGGDLELRSHVVEYRPPFSFPMQQLLPYWLMVLGALGSLYTVGRRVHWSHAMATTLFLILSLFYTRMIDAFAIVSAPLLAMRLSALPRRIRWRRWLPRLQRWVAPVVLAALALVAIERQWSRYLPGPGLDRRVWPTDLFAVIDAAALTGPAFVSDGWAGPFLAEYFPRERAFFDPRFEAYSRRFVFDVYRRIRYGEPGWSELLDRHGVELVLLKYTSPGEATRQQGRDNLRQRLAADPRWVLLAFNDYGELFVRREGQNGTAARRWAIEGVDPDRGTFLGRPAAAAPSLLSFIERGGGDNQVLVMAAVALADRGARETALRLLAAAHDQQPDDPRVAAARRMIGSP